MYSLKPSPIHGIGVYSTERFRIDEVVATALGEEIGHIADFSGIPVTGILNDNGTVWGVIEGFPLWYVNYSDVPNIENRMTPSGVIYITAIRDIYPGDEFTIGGQP